MARDKIGRAALEMAGLVLLLAFGTGPAGAVQYVAQDRGGALEQRYQLLEGLGRSGEEVRITGTCLSACTLYLGLARACVMPAAQLGFHGPGTRLPGLPLPAAEFERQSQRMASHYPPAIRDWFLREARWETRNLYILSGAQAIAMGARAC